ncbi:DUF305 domain-containing protein [Actinocrispum wychmicini]|uniref:Uncharacterized protein (DUF305 family) n=1 Tax=Actinocrispum wychmicini TaxID=1213861 RepID=A0A4R2JK29_9PSEU|nr:DUF305 domain-containing protein [Actinocrispum wychmicini]TCO57388.1 uncharacterized protein (DUF305 family) [Actinocrispum wychmicini]
MTVHDDQDLSASILDEEDGGPRPSRQRVIIFSAAALAILLVGAAIGMLITLASTGGDNVPDANSVDVGFAQDMSTHHLQAVSMASWVRDHTEDQEVKTLAFDIESTQKTQVGTFAGFLDLWNQPESRPPDRQAMSWMATPSAGGMHDMGGMNMQGMQPGQLMPGMATQEELAKLRKQTGKDLDVYFLQLMIRHHTGGLSMAKYGQDHAASAPVRNLAHTIVVGQTAEVTYMTSMLTKRGGQPLPNS